MLSEICSANNDVSDKSLIIKLMGAEASSELSYWQTISRNGSLLILARKGRGSLASALEFYRPTKRLVRILKWLWCKLSSSRFSFLIKNIEYPINESGVIRQIEKEIGCRVVSVMFGNPTQAHRRMLFRLIADDGQKFVLKLGASEKSINAIKRELNILNALPKSAKWSPKVVSEHSFSYAYGFVMLEVAGPSFEFNDHNLGLVIELLEGWSEDSIIKTKDSHLWNKVLGSCPEGYERKLNWLGCQGIRRSIYHGDLAAWNLIKTSSGYSVVDWEWGKVNSLAGLDLIHLICQDLILLDGIRDEKFVRLMLKKIKHPKIWLFLEKMGWLQAEQILFVYLASLNDEFIKPDPWSIIGLIDDLNI